MCNLINTHTHTHTHEHWKNNHCLKAESYLFSKNVGLKYRITIVNIRKYRITIIVNSLSPIKVHALKLELSKSCTTKVTALQYITLLCSK